MTIARMKDTIDGEQLKMKQMTTVRMKQKLPIWRNRNLY